MKMEDNELKLAQLMSAMEALEKRVTKSDTFDSFKIKTEKAVQESKEEVSQIAEILKTAELESKIRLQIRLESAENKEIPTFHTLEKGYTRNLGLNRHENHVEQKSVTSQRPTRSPELYLLPHLVFSVLKHKNIAYLPVKTPTESAASSVVTNGSLIGSQKSQQQAAAKEIPVVYAFIGTCIDVSHHKSAQPRETANILVLKIYTDYYRYIGNIHIQLSAKFTKKDIKEWRTSCSQTREDIYHCFIRKVNLLF